MLDLGLLNGIVKRGTGRREGKIYYIGPDDPGGASFFTKTQNKNMEISKDPKVRFMKRPKPQPVLKISPLKELLKVVNSVKMDNLKSAMNALKIDGFLSLIETDRNLLMQNGVDIRTFQMAVTLQCFDRLETDTSYRKRKSPIDDDFLVGHKSLLVKISKNVKNQVAARKIFNKGILSSPLL